MGSITRTIANNLTNDLGGAGGINFRNIIINGDMSIAQRGTSVSSITSSGYKTCDRWNLFISPSMGTWTQSQSTDVPTGQGFSSSLKMDCTVAQASPASSAVNIIDTIIEGQNLQYLKWGTSNAEQITLSFWHKHTKTGTNIIELIANDSFDVVAGSYTQSVSDTWEYATIIFPANTITTVDNDNGGSLKIRFVLASGTDYTSGTLATTWQDTPVSANRYSGQVNNGDSTANNFLITGVQLEAGTSATEFEFLPVDVNLQRCYRYYYLHAEGATQTIGTMWWYASGVNATTIFLKTTMRTTPSLSYTTGTNYYIVYTGGTTVSFDSFTGLANVSNKALSLDSNLSGTSHDVGRVATSTGGSIAFSAEL